MDISQDPDIVGAFNTKHQPSEHAMGVLLEIARRGSDGMPSGEMNFTVRDKLSAFGYITRRHAPSDHVYKTHKKGRTVEFLYITDAGRAALRSR